MVLKVSFAENNFSATQISLIMSMNGSLGMLLGPLIGLMQKICGCRKAALLAAFLTTFGIVLTSFSRSFTCFVVFYGMITCVLKI